MALLERAIFYQALLHTLVIMGAAENQSERPQLQETCARIAVACPETGDADQPLYPPAFHSAHQKRVASDIQGGELAPNARAGGPDVRCVRRRRRCVETNPYVLTRRSPRVFFMRLPARVSSDKPRLKAFCRVAFSVLFKARAILAADVFLPARAFNLRICSARHARLFARLLTIWRPQKSGRPTFVSAATCPAGSRPIRRHPDISR